MALLNNVDLSEKRTLYIVIAVAVGLFVILFAVGLTCCRRRGRKQVKQLPMHKDSERSNKSNGSSGTQLTTEIIVNNSNEDDVSTIGDDFDITHYPGAASILGMALKRSADSSVSAEESIKELIAASTVGGETTKEDTRYIAKAPPGKIGMIVDTAEADKCPYVHTIKANSVLIDQVRPGDRILSVNGHDVTAMTALEVSRLIAKMNPNESRTFELERYLQWNENDNWYQNSV